MRKGEICLFENKPAMILWTTEQNVGFLTKGIAWKTRVPEDIENHKFTHNYYTEDNELKCTELKT